MNEAVKRVPCKMCEATVLVTKASIAEYSYCLACGDRLREMLAKEGELREITADRLGYAMKRIEDQDVFAEAQAKEIDDMNKMRVHCEHCGADYLATGLEARCPCLLIEEIDKQELDKRELWIALLFAQTVGDRIIIGQRILGTWPEDIFDDDECPLCHTGIGQIEEK